MAFKTNIAPNTRTFIVSPNGNDSQDGQGPETALLTIATAIARINALVPPPGSDAADFSLIQIVGAGQFTESDLVFPTGCQVNAENTFLFPTGNGVTPGSITSMNIAVVFTVAAGAKAFTYLNALTIGVQSLSAVTVGANSFCTHVSGSCKELYIKIDQMRIGGDGSVGLLNNCDDPDPLTVTVDNMILNSNNTTGMLQSHATLNVMKTSISLISIVEETGTSLTGTIGVDIQRGICDLVASNIEAETAIHVGNGAELNLTTSLAMGDIIVDSGGVLNCNIVSHPSGTVTNNGTINGIINNDKYGNLDFVRSDFGVALSDINSNIAGYLSATDDLGVSLKGTTDTIKINKPIFIEGNNALITSDSLFMSFNGAAIDKHLKIVNKFTIDGKEYFSIGSVPIDNVVYKETFSSTSDVVLTNSFQNIVQGTVTNTYESLISYHGYSFLVENSSSSDITLEYKITKNDVTVVSPFSVEIPAKTGTTNGSVVLSSVDILTGDLAVSDTIEIQVRVVSGSGVTVKGSGSIPTALDISLTHIIDNTIVRSEGISSTSSSVYVTKLTLNTGTKIGSYRIAFTVTLNNAGDIGLVRLQNTTDATTISEQIWKPGDAAQQEVITGFDIVALDGTAKNFSIQWRDDSGGHTQSVRDARISLEKFEVV